MVNADNAQQTINIATRYTTAMLTERIQWGWLFNKILISRHHDVVVLPVDKSDAHKI